MKTNQELKNAALAALKGNWGPAVLVAFIVSLISVIQALVAPASLVVSICVVMPLSVGVYAAFRKLLLGQEVKLVEDSF
jgi:uncharacterized membrane protein